MRTILHIAACPFPAPRGSQVLIAGAASGQAAVGHRVAIACYANGEGTPPPGVEIIRGRAVPFAFSGSGPHPSKLLANGALIHAIRRWCGSERPDVIVAHNVEGPILARIAGVRAPVLWEVHTRMGAELPTFLPGTGSLGNVLDRAAASYSDAVITLSDAGASWLRTLHHRVVIAPPGIDIAELAQADPARARRRWKLDDRMWVAYAGNDDPYQDLPLLLDAMARCPGIGLLLVTAGDWQVRCVQAGIEPERLRCVQTNSLTDHLDAIAACDIAASPRTVCLGFPMKLLNHAGLGRPTVAAGDSARPMPGVVATRGTAESFATAIQGLAESPDLRTRLGNEARAAAAKMTWRRRALQLDQVISSVV